MKNSASATEPVVIGPGEHPITQEQIDPDACKVLRRLHDAGLPAYLVGGGVRDLYLGRKPKDFDISTEARPGQIRKLFRNSQTIGRRFRLVQVFFHGGKVIEVSTLRSLSEHDLEGPEAVLAPNNTFGTLDEDAQRRDLTINSLFYTLHDDSIIDYVGGIDDLDHSVIRIVGDPDRRIQRDPVRMLRAIRHAARLGFVIEGKSFEAIRRHHRTLGLCPPSRLRDELLKDLHSGCLLPWLELMLKSELFSDLLGAYEGIVYEIGARGETAAAELKRLCRVIDRFTLRTVENGHEKSLPNHFLLALLLIPWADIRFQLFGQQGRGRAIFQMAKKIRLALDEQIGQQLNLRRSFRQEMTSLLGNLPLFTHHGKSGNWPKWLKKKSYFKECSLFYRFYCEAWDEDQQSGEELIELAAPLTSKPQKRSSSGKSSHGRVRPAFAHASKRGVFGFKK